MILCCSGDNDRVADACSDHPVDHADEFLKADHAEMVRPMLKMRTGTVFRRTRMF